jgi:hypothetical protein
VGLAAITSPILTATVVVLGGMHVIRMAFGKAEAEAASGRLGYRPDGTDAAAFLHRLPTYACRSAVAPGPERRRLVVVHGDLPWHARAAAWVDDAHGRLRDACIGAPACPAPASEAGLRPA